MYCGIGGSGSEVEDSGGAFLYNYYFSNNKLFVRVDEKVYVDGEWDGSTVIRGEEMPGNLPQDPGPFGGGTLEWHFENEITWDDVDDYVSGLNKPEPLAVYQSAPLDDWSEKAKIVETGGESSGSTKVGTWGRSDGGEAQWFRVLKDYDSPADIYGGVNDAVTCKFELVAPGTWGVIKTYTKVLKMTFAVRDLEGIDPANARFASCRASDIQAFPFAVEGSSWRITFTPI